LAHIPFEDFRCSFSILHRSQNHPHDFQHQWRNPPSPLQEETSPEENPISISLPLSRVEPTAAAPTTVKPQLTFPENKHPLHYLHTGNSTTMSSDLDLDSIYTFALQLGKDAGQMLLEAAQRRMSGDDQLVEEEKLNSVDIVTKTDEGEFLCCLIYWGIDVFGI
jgi:hypothetical protein